MEHGEEDAESLDWENVSLEIEELRGKVDKMGNVNLEAIHEQTELEEREAHLSAQMEDLQTSEKALQDIINKINVTSRELFEKIISGNKRPLPRTVSKIVWWRQGGYYSGRGC